MRGMSIKKMGSTAVVIVRRTWFGAPADVETKIKNLVDGAIKDVVVDITQDAWISRYTIDSLVSTFNLIRRRGGLLFFVLEWIPVQKGETSPAVEEVNIFHSTDEAVIEIERRRVAGELKWDDDTISNETHIVEKHLYVFGLNSAIVEIHFTKPPALDDMGRILIGFVAGLILGAYLEWHLEHSSGALFLGLIIGVSLAVNWHQMIRAREELEKEFSEEIVVGFSLGPAEEGHLNNKRNLHLVEKAAGHIYNRRNFSMLLGSFIGALIGG
jgi:hypothetical protein